LDFIRIISLCGWGPRLNAPTDGADQQIAGKEKSFKEIALEE
jgi:hypothetical protein